MGDALLQVPKPAKKKGQKKGKATSLGFSALDDDPEAEAEQDLDALEADSEDEPPSLKQKSGKNGRTSKKANSQAFQALDDDPEVSAEQDLDEEESEPEPVANGKSSLSAGFAALDIADKEGDSTQDDESPADHPPASSASTGPEREGSLHGEGTPDAVEQAESASPNLASKGTTSKKVLTLPFSKHVSRGLANTESLSSVHSKAISRKHSACDAHAPLTCPKASVRLCSSLSEGAYALRIS